VLAISLAKRAHWKNEEQWTEAQWKEKQSDRKFQIIKIISLLIFQYLVSIVVKSPLSQHQIYHSIHILLRLSGIRAEEYIAYL
jgi:hypothetical protein